MDNQMKEWMELSKIRFLSFEMFPDEYFTGIGVNALGQLIVWSNRGRVWVNTGAPLKHFDMIEITALNREANGGGTSQKPNSTA